MTIRQQYTNEELVHKLRSMLNDLPTLRTRAIKKLKHWRETAIKRLLDRQRELEKTLLDKFERLEFDTQLFVEKVERKKANQQRHWQNESLDYQNKNDIDRISTNLKSIRKELEQSKLILAGTTIDDDMNELLPDDVITAKLVNSSRHNETVSSKTPVHKNYENNDLSSELKRVLEICTSPTHPSSTLSVDELSPLQSLDHEKYIKSKQTTPKTLTHPKTNSQTSDPPQRHSRTINNVLVQQQKESDMTTFVKDTKEGNNNQKLFAFESSDDSIRRFQRLREIRKNLRSKYDNLSQQQSTQTTRSSSTSTNIIENNEKQSDNYSGSPQKSLNQSILNGSDSIPPVPLTIKSSVTTNTTSPKKSATTRHVLSSRKPINIPIERISNTGTVELYDKISTNAHNNIVNTRNRRQRSRTLESHQIQAVDNQIYGRTSTSSKAKQRTESNQHHYHCISARRSSLNTRDKQLQLKAAMQTALDEAWLDIGQDHWVNLLENGWRATMNTPGVTSVIIADLENSKSHECKHINSNIDLYEQITKHDYNLLFEQLEFAYTRTINLGNEFWRFLEINGNRQLCLYHQLNKQFIMYKPDLSLLCCLWPYDGIVDISWSKTRSAWVVSTQTQIIICNYSFSKILQSIDINGDWPKRITSCQSSIFHTYKISPLSTTSSSNLFHNRPSNEDRPQFLLERYDYKLNSLVKHILESSTIWDIEADDVTEHLAVLCDVALLIFDYQLNLLKRIEVTGFKVSRDHFGGWLIADYNGSCIWQIKRNEYTKADKILHVERPWSVILDHSTWTLVTLSETQNRAKRLLFFNMKNLPISLLTVNSIRSESSQLSISSSSSISNSST